MFDGCVVHDKAKNLMTLCLKERNVFLYVDDTIGFEMMAMCSVKGKTLNGQLEQLTLWHFRLCHLLFVVLDKMFLDFFKYFDQSSLLCDTWQYVKHKRASFITSE